MITPRCLSKRNGNIHSHQNLYALYSSFLHNRQNPKCPWIRERTIKRWNNNQQQKEQLLMYATREMNLKSIIQSERSQCKKLPTAWFCISEKQVHGNRKPIVGARGSEQVMGLTTKEHRHFLEWWKCSIFWLCSMSCCMHFQNPTNSKGWILGYVNYASTKT